MATLSKTSSGAYVIQYANAHRPGRRSTLHLGKVAKKTAEVARSHIEHLLTSRRFAAPIPLPTSQWLADIDPKLHQKIADAGLAAPRVPVESVGIKTRYDEYLGRRKNAEPSTLKNHRQTREVMIAFFSDDRDPRTITAGEARDWQRKLEESYSPSTVTGFVVKATAFAADLMSRNQMESNPFAGLPRTSMVNDEESRYVPVEEVTKVIDACPNVEWQLVFALARHGGLRMPSESDQLRWSDIDWANGRITVRSPKTAHQGKSQRTIPLFPALRPFLELARSLAAGEYVMGRLRGKRLASQGARIVCRAGLVPWPRLYKNLRASCETDLATRYPLHVACAWIGNSKAVAQKHYLMTHDGHFANALQNALRSPSLTTAQEPNHMPETPLESGESRKGGPSARAALKSSNLLPHRDQALIAVILIAVYCWRWPLCLR